jgi:hypothetical protein
MFSLFGLEDFAENPYSEQHLEKHLNSKVLIGEIISSQEDYDADFNSRKTPKEDFDFRI